MEKLNINIQKHINLDVKGMEKFPITYIFAKNGVGKTTYTREVESTMNDDNTFIFNEDYIARNVFIPSIDSNDQAIIKLDKTKYKAFDILLGETSTTKFKEMAHANESYDSKTNEIKELINKGYVIDTNMKIPSIIEMRNLKNSIREITSKELELEVLNKIETQNNISNLQLFEKKQLIITENIKLINEKIIEYNNISSFQSISNEVLKILKEASELEEIFFVDKLYKQKEIKDYIKSIQNDKLNLFEEIKNLSKSIEDEKREINLLKENIEKAKNINANSDLIEINKINLQEINEFDTSSTQKLDKLPEINFLLKIDSIEEINEQINKYIELNKQSLLRGSSEILKLLNEEEDLKGIYDIKRKEFDKEQAKINGGLNDRINSFLKSFGFQYMELVISTKIYKGKKSETNLTIKDKDITKTSKGERSAIALAFFLTDLERNAKDKDILVIIDDPFDSNDHHKAGALPNITFNSKGSKVRSIPSFISEVNVSGNKEKLIILTHNINVLYSLTMNLMGNGTDETNGFFHNVDKDIKQKIEIKEWVKKGNKIKEENIDFDSYFPNEYKIRETVLNELKEKITLITSNKDNANIFRSIVMMLVKMTDKIDNSSRQKLKEVVLMPCWKYGKKFADKQELKDSLAGLFDIGNINDEFINELFTLNKNNELLDSEVSSIFENFNLKDKTKKLICEYIKRYITEVNEAIENSDTEKLKRSRHNFHLINSILSYGLTEV